MAVASCQLPPQGYGQPACSPHRLRNREQRSFNTGTILYGLTDRRTLWILEGTPPLVAKNADDGLSVGRWGRLNFKEGKANESDNVPISACIQGDTGPFTKPASERRVRVWISLYGYGYGYGYGYM